MPARTLEPGWRAGCDPRVPAAHVSPHMRQLPADGAIPTDRPAVSGAQETKR